MRFLYTFTGIILVSLSIGDMIWTSLWVDGGAGPIANRLTTLIWKLLIKLNEKKRNILTVSGPVILISTLVFWILLLWAGWTLIFAGSAQSIIDTVNGEQIAWNDLVYYTGYVIFTLGNGGFSPEKGLWQIVTTIATGSGMLFLTLGASYILSIVGAVVKKRSFASSVTGIGKCPDEMVLSAWNGESLCNIDLLLSSLSSEISTLTHQHRAYPLLHYYHTHKPEQAIAVAVPIIDEALSIMEFGVEKEAKPNSLLLKSIRSAIGDYLETMNEAFIDSSNKALDLPDLNRLRENGIPVVSDEEFEKNMEQIEERRKKLLGLLTSDNWREEEIF